ncbi:uncharacterized protein BP5553_00309 [Venustampulla echinocandica]|uniref:Uncharacterized protein n=1 Tax=Venustampulla echinocandica TaxID=2656787 RepID=A0A370TXU5_9HELO|nr:uncharacterized protein BP5553_00309 [Venustampulla echinocandica]RDL40330.1 hypothetical protein BP5553_00309 [Venustampulla echinocandica]
MAKRYKALLLITTISLSLLAWHQYTKSKTWWSFPNYDDGSPAGERAIYTVDDRSARLHTSTNKGKESLAYLTYIISHYSSLPSTVVFLHSHRSGYLRGWHTDAWGWDNVRALRSLRLSYVQESGYVILRCNWKPGCLPAHYSPNTHVTKEVWLEVFGYGANGTAEQVPDQVGQACCPQFAVSRTQIIARPLEDYISYRQWVLDTEMSDEKSGRVMEFLWHVIFGKGPVYCPEPSTCYCKVYGRCD